jgi:hypothetical protein
MRSGSSQSHPSDTFIGIVIATIGTLVLLSRLHAFPIGFNPRGLRNLVAVAAHFVGCCAAIPAREGEAVSYARLGGRNAHRG